MPGRRVRVASARLSTSVGPWSRRVRSQALWAARVKKSLWRPVCLVLSFRLVSTLCEPMQLDGFHLGAGWCSGPLIQGSAWTRTGMVLLQDSGKKPALLAQGELTPRVSWHAVVICACRLSVIDYVEDSHHTHTEPVFDKWRKRRP